MNISYRTFELKDSSLLEKMILDFYVEDASMKVMSQEKIQKTLYSLLQHPDRGTTMLMEINNEIIWYALLINFRSNEFGWNLLNIDELYIKPAHRSKGIGTEFIKHLIDTKYADLVGIQLEVTPSNERAKNLYTRIGFETHKYEQLTYEHTS